MASEEQPAARSSAWAPFRSGVFRAMWSAQFVSNIGGWMQTVGAQWLMLSLTTAAAPVALIQTASSLPVLLFAVPAGAVGDLVDRRRFLLLAQTFMLLAALALGVLALEGLVTPVVLLALVFALGAGQAWTSPTWQTLQPELVPAAERPQAIALGSVNMNLSRAVGPAIGGLLVAATSVGSVFLINAASFLAVIVVVLRWRGGGRREGALAPEHVGEAIRAGGRYVAASPALRVVLLRSALFVFFASSIWALLPLTARTELHLGSGGYGLLLGCVGIGAVVGAALLPRLRNRLTPGAMLSIGSVVVGALALVLAYVHVTALVGVALAIGGTAWILALSTLNSVYQSSLPGWVKARGMGFYLIVFQGGNAIGSAAIGLAAGQAGLSPTLLVAGIGLVLGPLAGLRFPLKPLKPEELLPAGDWPVPQLISDETPGGPVMVSVEYWPRAGIEDNFLQALHEARFSRRRTGASSWRVWRDSSEPNRFIEQFVVVSWQEHLRQHERVTARDQERFDRIRAMTDPDRPTTVTHWTAPRLDRDQASN
ncbi:MAG TPA: MFS transporter [Solirubrobacteraceae bacterium]|nr:MFS transporter [Solirubrobacteraceae bacterium]